MKTLLLIGSLWLNLELTKALLHSYSPQEILQRTVANVIQIDSPRP